MRRFGCVVKRVLRNFSNFPPLRQFGIITASAFLLAMIADFTALPGSLWIVRRERPESTSDSTTQDSP